MTTGDGEQDEKTRRRDRGDGGLYWSEQRQRWIAEVTLGFDGRGKRITRKASGRTKTAAKNKLREITRDVEDGTVTTAGRYTVTDAVADWLTYGVAGRATATVDNYRTLSDNHIVTELGALAVRDLTADEVDRWLHAKARTLSTRTLRLLHSILARAIGQAMARDRVKRNVVLLCTPPKGRPGRPSKSLTLEQAVALLDAAVDSILYAYIVLGLLTGVRTEELRALTWGDTDLDGDPDTEPPVPPWIAVVRSVRVDDETKTEKSRRRLALPHRCVAALRAHRDRRATPPRAHDLVFPSRAGTRQDAHNVRRAFRKVIADVPGMDPKDWTPRELRHSFVSLLSADGVRIEDIARLVGHTGGSAVTERVYRKQLRPVLDHGATAMNGIFPITDD